MTAEELIKILQQYPQDAQIQVSPLCWGLIDDEDIEYRKDINTINFI